MKLLTILFCLMMILTGKTLAQMPPLETGVSQSLAKWRGANYSDVRYSLIIKLEKGAPLMTGTLFIRVNLTETGAKNDLILDWRTTQFANDKDKPFAEVTGVNDAAEILYSTPNEHIRIPKDLLKKGENVIRIKFASPIKTSGAAITRYIDKEDGAEYIYSLFVPSDASTAFPIFDQPDLKARFKLSLVVPEDWKTISNTDIVRTAFGDEMERFKNRTDNPSDYAPKGYELRVFLETKPISTYVFSFAAGQFSEFWEGIAEPNPIPETVNFSSPEVLKGFKEYLKNPFREELRIYVRKSQAEKFKQHSAEVFRLNREGVKFLESYFDYKFPFPKYDLVLIPEFPFGGMEHAGATFLRETSVIFPTEPTKNDYVSRANLIFHEAAHQWFGDTVTMKWFDDLWLKEGFAEFMAYKTLAQVMPEYNAWKIFYERNKQAAYLTDSTRGTTPIYQEIPNLSSAKSAYGNIVYRKAPSFLKQAEFYLGNNKFQEAVRSFLKKYQYKNAGWQDLVKEFEVVACFGHRSWTYSEGVNGQRIREMKCLDESGKKTDLSKWADSWVKKRGVPIIRVKYLGAKVSGLFSGNSSGIRLPSEEVFQKEFKVLQRNSVEENSLLEQEFNVRLNYKKGNSSLGVSVKSNEKSATLRVSELAAIDATSHNNRDSPVFVFPNYQDYGYGIFLLDEKSRAYVLENIQNEKDDFLRSMMWGSLWDSVREGELDPREYVELVIKNLNVETDESTIQTLLGRTSTAMNYYLSEPPAVAGGSTQPTRTADKSNAANAKLQPSATADGSDLQSKLETLLIDKIQNAPTQGLRITFYRAFLNIASSQKARIVLYDILNGDLGVAGGNTKMRPGMIEDKQGNKIYASGPAIPLKPKDRADIIAKLFVMGDANASDLLKDFEKSPFQDVDRYAYAARAAFATKENKAKYWNDFINDKNISESWIESAFATFNSSKQTDLTLPYLEKALTELPNLKRNRKIFFVNGWLSSFIGGQKSEEALGIVNKFLADNPNLDKDLRLKILENSDGLERAVKIRKKFEK